MVVYATGRICPTLAYILYHILVQDIVLLIIPDKLKPIPNGCDSRFDELVGKIPLLETAFGMNCRYLHHNPQR